MWLDDVDNTTPDVRSEAILGGYRDDFGTSDIYKDNWRYYADIYYDRSWARVILANSEGYTQATIVEPQVPLSWSNTSIVLRLNMGQLTSRDNIYAFVFDSLGRRSSLGHPVITSRASEAPPSTTGKF